MRVKQQKLNNSFIGVPVPTDMKERLVMDALERDVSMSAYVRAIIAAYYKNADRRKK